MVVNHNNQRYGTNQISMAFLDTNYLSYGIYFFGYNWPREIHRQIILQKGEPWANLRGGLDNLIL